MAGTLHAVLIVAIFAAALNNSAALTDEKKAEISAKVDPIIQECSKEYGVTAENLADFKAQKKIPDDSNKCFFACVFKKTGLLDSKGQYDEAAAKQIVPGFTDDSKKEQAVQAAVNCNSVNAKAVSDGEAGCDRAIFLFQCILEQKQVELYGL